jgi:hypothetical protein
MFNFWFISPWQAARMAFEVQRVMANNWLLPFAYGGTGGQPVTPRILDQSAPAKEPRADDESARLKAMKSETPKRAQTVAAHQATGARKRSGRPNKKRRPQGKRAHRRA